ncbi:MAG: hypothetical protein JXA25_04630 [Anaerolineales bacterium]|nr:hypothetical protein [Anaerolineales bacterium]
MLTIFSAPKPFEGPIGVIQYNALRSWAALDGVEVFVIGDEAGIAEAAAEVGVRYFPDVERNEYGTPLLSSIFATAHQHSTQPLMVYVNADIILFKNLLPAVVRAQEKFERFLLIGRRWDLDVTEQLEFSGDWESALRQRISQAGILHKPAGSDYFVYPRTMYTTIPPFALGRAGWDNWMIYACRHSGAPVIDATQTVTIVHQNHDYAHLPDGKPHYRLPESYENVRMGGGHLTVFKLRDANWELTPDFLRRKPLRWRGLLRRVEMSLIARAGAGKISTLVHLLFHPKKIPQVFRQIMNRE